MEISLRNGSGIANSRHLDGAEDQQEQLEESRTSNGTEAAHNVPFSSSAVDHQVLALPTISHDTTLQRAMLVSVVERDNVSTQLILFCSCGSMESC
jgi:hypothetical protein